MSHETHTNMSNYNTSKALAKWLITYRTPLVILSIIALVISYFGIDRLKWNGDFRHMFGDDNPELMQLDKIEAQFLQADNVVILLQPPNKNVFTRETLTLIEELTEKAWTLPYSMRVDSVANFQRSVASEDAFMVSPLVEDAQSLTDEELAELREYALNDAYLSQGLVSLDSGVTSIMVTLALPLDPLDRLPAVTELKEALDVLGDEYREIYPDMVIHFSGGPMMESAMVGIAQHDMWTYIPITFVVIFVALGILLRAATPVFGTLFIILASILCTIGFIGYSPIALTPSSMMAPIMVMILAMADSIHILTQYTVFYRQGMEKVSAMERALELNLRPILLTTVTTAIGFIGMNFSESPAMHDFGNIAAVGVFFAYFLSVTLLPGFMLWFPVKDTNKPLAMTGFMDAYAEFVIKNNKALFIIFLIGVPVISSFMLRNELNDDIVNYFDEDTEFKQAVDFASEHLSGFQYILYSLDSGKANHVNDHEFLTKVDQFSEWYRDQDYVANVFSYVDIMKNLNQAMHGDDEAFNSVPESRQLAAQYMLLYEMSLPAGQDMTRDVDNDRSALRLMVSLKSLSNNELIDLDLRAQQWLETNAPEMASPGASRSLMFARVGSRIVKSMLEGSGFALIFITFTIMAGIRSIRFGLVSIIPNVFPALVVYGVWGLLVGEVNQAAAMTYSMTIGLVVDDTVHFLTKYLHGREEGKSPEDSIRWAFSMAGTALMVTSLAICSGQTVMAFSNFKPNITTSVMMISILMFALIVDFMFLPGLLMRYEEYLEKREQKKARKAGNTVSNNDKTDTSAETA